MGTTTTLSNNWKLVICIIICQATGIISGLSTYTQNNVWKNKIVKPNWSPPSYIFGPVWTISYFLMGILLWIIWISNIIENQKMVACLLFGIQLFLNFWWTVLFFKFHFPIAAYTEIIETIALIAITIYTFSEVSKTAAWVLVPCISWVCFAAILNYNLWILNK